MKGFCECGHISRKGCKGHTIQNCEHKYKRKLMDWRNRIRSVNDYTNKYRDHLWSKGDYGIGSPEFNFLIGVEQLTHLFEDVLNHEFKAHDLPTVSSRGNEEGECCCCHYKSK